MIQQLPNSLQKCFTSMAKKKHSFLGKDVFYFFISINFFLFLFTFFLLSPFSNAALIDTDWTGGTGNWSVSGNWSGGVVPDNSVDTYNVRIDNGVTGTNSVVSLNQTATISGFVIDSGDTLGINDGQWLDLKGGGTYTDNGLLNINGAASNTYLYVDTGTVTIDGAGKIVLGGTFRSNINGTGTTPILNNALGHTIEGGGDIGENTMGLINAGDITATNGTITIDVNGSGFTNTGTVKANTSQTMTINGSTVTNTGGLIRAEDGSTVNITSSTVTGGDVDIIGGGALNLNSSNVNATITNSSTGVITNIGSSDIGGTFTNVAGGQLNINDGTNLEFLSGISLTNDGTISVNGSAGNTYLYATNGTVTFDGTGKVVLNADPQANIRGTGTTPIIENSATHTFEGGGDFGENTVGIINHGLIQATTGTMTIDANTASGLTNDGTIKATSGRTMTINGSTVTNTGGLIRAEDTGTVNIVSSTVTGGDVDIIGGGALNLNSSNVNATITNSSTGVITNLGSSDIGGTFTNVAGGQLDITDGSTLEFLGGITLTNDGTISVNGSAGNTYLYATNGTVTFGGTGKVVLNADPQANIRGTGTTPVIENSSGHTFEGGGDFGENTVGIINHGLIQATTGTMTIDANTASGLTNDGTIKATSGRTLVINGSNVTNFVGLNDGLIRAENGGTVNIASSTVTGGDVDNAGTGILNLSSSSLLNGTVTNVSTGTINSTATNTISGTLNSDGTINVNNASSLYFKGGGTYTNDGVININGGGSNTYLYADTGTATFGGTGKIVLGGTTRSNIRGSGTTPIFENALGHTIEGGGDFGENTVGIINHGLIQATTGTMTIDVNGSGLTNDGTIKATTGRTMTITGSTVTNTGGLIRAEDGATVNITSSTVTGGDVDNAGTGILNLSSSSLLNGTVTNVSTGTINSSATNTISGTLNSDGTINVNNASSFYFKGGGTYTNDGVININGGGNATYLYADTGTATFGGTGKIVLGGTTNSNIRGSGTTPIFENALGHTIEGGGDIGENTVGLINHGLIQATTGTIKIDVNGSGLTNDGTIKATTGRTMTINGSIVTNTGGLIRAEDGSTVNLTSSTMTGGDVDIIGGGALNLSSSTVNGTLTNSTTGVITTTSGTNDIGGTFNNVAGGQLNINNATNLEFLGGISLTNDGTISVNGSTSNTYLYAKNGTVQFDGIGKVVLAADPQANIQGTGTTPIIINSSTHTFEGGGDFGENTVEIVNHGLIQATTGTMTIDVNGSGLTNDGTIKATTGRTMTINGSNVTNFVGLTDGLIRAEDGGTVNINSSTVTGGDVDVVGAGFLNLNSSTVNSSVTNSSTGIIRSNSGSNAISGTTLNNPLGGQVIINNSTSLQLGAGTHTNDGTITLNGTGGNTYFYVTESGTVDSVTLSGSGVLNISNSANNHIYSPYNANDRLINAVNHTIRGSGDVGSNTLAFTNDGLIESNQSVRMDLNPTDNPTGGNINTGIIQANGGTMRLHTATWDNTSGEIKALTGSLVEMNGATITGGVLSTTGTGIIRNISTVTYDGNGAGIDLTGNFEANNSTQTYVRGDVALNGTYDLNSTGGNTYFYLYGDTVLSGNGTLSLSNNSNNHIYSSVGGNTRLTNPSTFTIEGSGDVGSNSLAFTNDGLIEANQSVRMDLNPTDNPTGGNFNNATIQANGGTLRMHAGVWDNTSGEIKALDGSLLEMNGVTIKGGTVSTAGSGEVRHISTTTYDGIASGINLTGKFEQNNGTTTYIGGTVTHNGTYDMNSTGGNTYLRILDNTTLTGTGTLTLDSPNGSYLNNVYANDGIDRLTVDTTYTIQGLGDLGANSMALTNLGLIHANVASGSYKLEIDPNASGVLNQSTIKSTNGAKLYLTGGSFDNTTGMIFADASTIRVQSATVTGGDFDLLGASTLELSSGNIIGTVTLDNSSTGVIKTIGGTSRLGGTVNNPVGGEIEIGNSTALIIDGGTSFNNDGIMTLNGTGGNTYFYVTQSATADSLTLSGSGVLNISNSSNNHIYSPYNSNDRLINTATHTIRGSGDVGSNTLAFTNEGLLEANQSVRMNLDPTNSPTGGNINTGIIQANGGTMRMHTATWDNSSGEIKALDGSLVEMNGVTIQGGTLSTAGSGIIRHISTTIYDATGGMNLTGKFEQNNSTSTYMKGDVVLNGTYDVNSTGGNTYLLANGDLNFTGNGTITLSNQTNNHLYSNTSGNTRLTLGSNITLKTTGDVGSNQLKMTNNGLIDAKFGTTTFDMTDAADGFINNGTFQVSNGATLDLNNTTYTNDGLFKATSGGTMLVDHNVSGTGSWSADGGTFQVRNGSDISTTGNIDILNGGRLQLDAHASNATITGDNLSLNGSGSSISINSQVSLTGSFDFNITDETDWVWGGSSVLAMNGGVGLVESQVANWATLEIGGEDFGTDPVNHTPSTSGFSANNGNFHLTELVIGSNAHVTLVDSRNNANRVDNGFGTDEALYVDTLTFTDADSRLNLNEYHIYYNTVNLPGGAVLGDLLLPDVLNTLIVNNTGNGNPIEIGDGIIVTFDDVTADGKTKKSQIVDQGVFDSFLGEDFVGNIIEETFYDISTTASFDISGSNGFLVKVPYDQAAFDASIGANGFTEDQLKLFHKLGSGVIEDVTATPAILAQYNIFDPVVDTTNNFIYGFATSFSPFGVGVNPEPATLILLGSGLLGLLPIRKKRFK